MACHVAARRLLAAAVAISGLSEAFYLPGFAPREYNFSEGIEMKVNKMTSSKTQLPYSYYKLPYCQPAEITEVAENLGETLMGDLEENSAYTINVMEDDTCRVLCKRALSSEDRDRFKSMIKDEYTVNWMVDNLPAATRYRAPGGAGQSDTFTYADGFLVGVEQQGRYFLHNHVLLAFRVHMNAELYEGIRIVGFDVEPRSMVQSTREDKDEDSGFQGTCQDDKMPMTAFELDAHDEIVYTYDVSWTYSEVRWVSRWDSYLKMTGGKIHWFAILNSLMILLFLSGMLAMILLRTLHRDITKYNELVTAEEAKEETGWKLVHGDVFRKPEFSTLLSVSVGTGLQILGMSVVTLLFALLGFLSPAQRGGLLQSMMLLYTFMGLFAGYTAARMCKIFEGDSGRWKTTTILTATFYPGLFFIVFFILNLFIWGQKSSGAVPFTTMFAIVLLWFGVSVPLVLLGAHAGFRKPAIELPVRVCQIKREIPEQPWFMKPMLTSLVGGVLPFGAVFTELYFIMASIWQHQFYYLFGFLALVVLIVIITCAEISIALTYFQLTSEDYRWWWPSFFSSGTSAVYVFLYSILYFSSRLQIEKLVSTMLYFGYMGIMSIMFFLLTGSIGMVASFFFVRAIYGSIKID